MKWFEVKKWTLVSKKLDLVHVKEKMLTQIELFGKMGSGDQEVSRHSQISNFEVIVKSIEVSFMQLKLRKGLKWRSNCEFWGLLVFIDVKEVIWSQKVDFGFKKVGLRTRERENVNVNWVIWEDGVRGSGAE